MSKTQMTPVAGTRNYLLRAGSKPAIKKARKLGVHKGMFERFYDNMLEWTNDHAWLMVVTDKETGIVEAAAILDQNFVPEEMDPAKIMFDEIVL